MLTITVSGTKLIDQLRRSQVAINELVSMRLTQIPPMEPIQTAAQREAVVNEAVPTLSQLEAVISLVHPGNSYSLDLEDIARLNFGVQYWRTLGEKLNPRTEAVIPPEERAQV